MKRRGAKITRNGDRRRAPLRGSPPTLEEEMYYWEWCIAEASLALERTENPREKATLRRYLEAVLAKHRQATERLAALDKAISLAGAIL